MMTLLDIVKNHELTSAQKQENIAALSDINLDQIETADALICAASAGDNALLQQLLDLGLDVNSKNADKWTVLLQVAAHDGNRCIICKNEGSPGTDTVRIVLEARPNIRTTFGRFNRTALDWSAFRGKVDFARLIIQYASQELAKDEFQDYVNHPSFRGKAPIHLAAQHGYVEMLRTLLEFRANINATCFAQQTALHLATSTKHLHTVQFLLNQTPAVDVNAKMADRSTALHLAVETKRKDIVETILKQNGVLTNERNALSYTPLLKAKELDNDDIANLLLGYVFHIEEFTPAYIACESYKASVTDFFVSANHENFADSYKAPVRRVLYENIIKARKSQVLPPKDPLPTRENYMSLLFQWTNLPSNNTAWAETLITKRCMRSSASDVPEYARILTVLYQVQNRFKLHSRQLKPECTLPYVASPELEVFGGLFMPYLRWQTDKLQQRLRSELEKISDSEAPDLQHLGKEEALLRGYRIHKTTALHLRRTLDQFRYPAMSTRTRDRDQVVYRYYKRRYEATGKDKWKEPRIYMVDQLWLWYLPDKLITCMPEIEDGRDVCKDVIYDINVHGDQVSDRVDLIAVIFDRCLGLFDRHYPHHRELRFFEHFEWSLGDITEEVNNLLKSFESDISKVTKWLDRKKSHANDPSYAADKKIGEDDKYDEEHLLFINRLIDISRETELHFECVDMNDELISLSMVLDQQLEVVTRFWAVAFRTSVSTNRKYEKEYHHKQILADDQSEIRRLQGQIKDVEKILSELLDMKPRYATAIEARFTRDQAEDTARQGQILMVFTIVTIIFLPLSFLAAFFAINIAAFPRVGDGYLSLGWVSKYVFGIGLGFSVPLIVLAFAFGDIQIWKQRIKGLLHMNRNKEKKINLATGATGVTAPVMIGNTAVNDYEQASLSSVRRLRESLRSRSTQREREKDEESGETQ